jgi:hypothetical protein
MLHMAMAGQWADAALPVVSENVKAKAKKLLKTNKMAKGDDEHARGMRAYFRAVASGRNAEYLLTQKGEVGKGAKHAKKLLAESLDEDSSCAKGEIMVFGKCRGLRSKLRSKADHAHDHLQKTVKKHGINHPKTQSAAQKLSHHIGKGEAEPHHVKAIKDLTQKQKDWAVKQKGSFSVAAGVELSEPPLDEWTADDLERAERDQLPFGFYYDPPAKQRAVIKTMMKPQNMRTYSKVKQERVKEAARELGLLKDRPPKTKPGSLMPTLAQARRRLEREKKKRRNEDLDEDFTAADLDQWWSATRPKLVKGSRATRHRRMDGCIKSLRALRDGGVVGGISQPELNPVPRKVRDTEDQPVPVVGEDTNIEENTMNLNDAISRFRSLDEANIPAPAVSKPLAGGGKQFSSKSKFKHYAGPGETYTGASAPIPADPKAKAAEPYYPAVKGPVGPDAREYVDVRVEHMDPNTLIGLIEQIAEASDSLEEFAQLIEQHLGFDAVIQNLSECENVDDAEALVGRIFEHTHADHGPDVADMQETEAQLRDKGMGIDDFDVHGDSWDEDQAFANDMMGLGEANIPAPKTGKKNAGGKQLDPKSRFAQPYKGPGETYTGDPASVPADKEPQKADTYYGKATGQGPSGREEVDVRAENREPVGANEIEAFAHQMRYPTKDMKDR